MSSGLVMEGGLRPDDVPGGLPSRPAWMKSPRPAKPAAPAASPVVVIDPAESALPVRPTTWSAQLARIVFRAAFGWGWLVSGLIHLAILTSLGVLVYHQKTTETPAIIGVFGAAGDETILDSGTDLDAGGSLAPLEFETAGSTNLIDPTANGSIPARVFGDVEGMVGGNGQGDGGNGSGGLGSVAGNLRVPPPSAITKGSFTVWTEPKDPLPRERYEIIIEVKLSTDIKGYRLRDLTGIVTGTDDFEKPIKFKSTERRAVKDGRVQVRIPIPGADRLVRDTIRVRSEVLKEEQTIEIVF